MTIVNEKDIKKPFEGRLGDLKFNINITANKD